MQLDDRERDRTLKDLGKVAKEKRATIIQRPLYENLSKENGVEEETQAKEAGYIKERDDARYIRWYFTTGLSRNITNKIIKSDRKRGQNGMFDQVRLRGVVEKHIKRRRGGRGIHGVLHQLAHDNGNHEN